MRRTVLGPLVRGSPPRGGECGSATLGLVVAFPALLALILLTVQAGLLIHARHLAQAAAVEGLRQVRMYGGSTTDGQHTAAAFLTQTGPGLLTGVRITATRGPASAAVTVSGTAPSLLPGLPLHVTADATGPIEQFQADARGFANSDGSSGSNSVVVQP